MGAGSYDPSATSVLYRSAATTAATKGYDPSKVGTFVYDADVKSGRANKVHESLDPALMKNGVRESRDSDEHPYSVPVAVCIDVTASMDTAPKRLFDSIGPLMGAIVKNGALDHPQVLFAAVGDAHCDDFSFQVTQAESSNEMEKSISNMILEGGGGGNGHESYDLYMYFLARCTKTDSWEKRKKKGYAFLIQDEPPPPSLPKDHVKKIFNQVIEEDISFREICQEAQKTWEVFILRPKETYHGANENITKQWEKLFPGQVIPLQSIDGICEQIAMIIANEEGVDLDVIEESLVKEGSSRELVLAAKANIKSGGALVKGTTDLNITGKPAGRL